MVKCYRTCKYYCNNFCAKYKKDIIEHKDKYNSHLKHPLGFLTAYYNTDEHNKHLIKLAYEFGDIKCKSIVKYYREHGELTAPQRKFLVRYLTHCCIQTVLDKSIDGLSNQIE